MILPKQNLCLMVSLLDLKNLKIVPLYKVLQMLKKGNKLYSILTGSCPRCHQESMYLDKNPYHMSKIFKMHERCFVIAKLIIGANLIQTFIAIVITMIVFMPVIMRLSRNIWINIFVKYNSKVKLKNT